MVATRLNRHLVLALFAFSGVAAADEHCIVVRDFLVTPPPGFDILFLETAALNLVSPGATRTQSRIVLEPLKGAPLAKHAQSTALPNDGLALNYDTDVVSGGSGGPEATLRGQLLHKSEPVFNVRCNTQSEHSVDPAWCLETLRSLSHCGARCACPPN
jgi:hypothetical protein